MMENHSYDKYFGMLSGRGDGFTLGPDGRPTAVNYDDKGIDYLVEKWYRPHNRPFRMCQPRDLLDQMVCIAKYNMEQVSFSPDLIDAACLTYFVSQEKKDFGAQVRLK